MKLDRTAHSAYRFVDQPKERSNYEGLNLSELAEVFNQLQKTAYQMEDYPKMDKTYFSFR